MQRYAYKVLLALCATILLSPIAGCTGQAAVLREDAGSTAQLMAAAVTEARDFYRKEADRQLNYYLDILSQDPVCPANSWVLVTRETKVDAAPFRCLTEAEILRQRDCPANQDVLCNKVDVLYLSTAGASFQYVLTLIGVIAEYQVQLAEIARLNRFDTANDLSALRARVEDFKAKIDVLLGNSPAGSQRDDDPIAAQITAVAPLLDILRIAADDAQALDKLRATLISQGPVLEAVLDQLASRYANVDLQAARLSDLQQVEKARMAYNARVSEGRTVQDSPESRREALAEIHQSESALRERISRPDALSLVLSQLASSHRSLREAVVDGSLTDDQRRRIAEKNIATLKAAFGAVVGIVKVFS